MREKAIPETLREGIVDLSRRRNEYKTRPCSLVSTAHPGYTRQTPSTFHVPSSARARPPPRVAFLFVPLCLHQRDDITPKWFISRGSSGANGSSGPVRPKERTTRRPLFPRARTRPRGDEARARYERSIRSFGNGRSANRRWVTINCARLSIPV